MFSKRDFSYVADTIVSAGAIATVVDYALMPKVRLATIIDQVRRAKSWVFDYVSDYGGDPSRITVSGHSAGAHLSTFLFHAEDGPSRVQGAMLLGGLYDLKPLQSSFLPNEIGLTDKEVADYTPLWLRHDANVRVALAAGAEETPPLHRQTEEFTTLLRRQGLDASAICLANADHMSSVLDLGNSAAPAGRCLIRLIHNS
jgi:arylformamidase